MNPWEEIEPGEHKYPFALKVTKGNMLGKKRHVI
jgi:hypothetical protein